MRKALLVLCVVPGLFAAGCASKGAGSDDAGSSGSGRMTRTESGTLETALPRAEKAWAHKIVVQKPGVRLEWVGLHGDLLLAVTSDDVVHAIGTDGTPRWVFTRLPGGLDFPPSASREHVVFVSRGDLYAVDRATGALRNIARTGLSPSAAPAVGNGTAYLPAMSDGRIHAIDLLTGQKGWHFRFGGLVDGPPLASGEGTRTLVHCPVGARGLETLEGIPALTAGPKETTWRATMGGGLAAPMTISGNVILATARDWAVYAFSRGSGELLWAYHAGVPLRASAVGAGDLVYVRANHELRAVRGDNGDLAWKIEGATSVLTPWGGQVLLRAGPREIIVVDAKTGTVDMRVTHGEDHVLMNPDGDRLYTARKDGSISCTMFKKW